MRDVTAEECFFGSVTVGERGQVVIPSDVRKSLRIEPGDRLLVFRHPVGHGIMMTKIDSVQEVIGYFQRALDALGDEPDDGAAQLTAHGATNSTANQEE